MRNSKHRLGLLLAALCWSVTTWSAGSNPDAGKPITIESDRAHMDDAKKLATYEGNVLITQGSMRITAAKVDAQQDAAGYTLMVATGDPAYLTRREDNGQWMESWARQVDYNSRAEQVILTGQAHLRRGQDDVRGNVITYNMKTQVYQADGGHTAKSRVKAVIQPKSEPSP